MRKIIVLTILLIPNLLMAQNPDGKNASLHISPAWLWGKADYDRYAPYLVPQTQVSPSYFQTVRDLGTVKYPYAFSIDVMLKIPTASFLTMSVSYTFYQRFEEIYTPYNVNNAFYYWSVKGGLHKVGFTASIYNLFSIY